MKKSLPFFAIMSIFLLVTVPQAFSLQEEDTDTTCRDDLVLVFKIQSNQYICTSEETAEKWVKIGVAEYANPPEDSEESVEAVYEIEESTQYSDVTYSEGRITIDT